MTPNTSGATDKFFTGSGGSNFEKGDPEFAELAAPELP
jgi:hypothetical protein